MRLVQQVTSLVPEAALGRGRESLEAELAVEHDAAAV
jgi:hypothetical protein